MLVVIGKNLINPQQITHITEERLSREEDDGLEGAKVINIHMSNLLCLSYIAGQEGYAAACKLRDNMLNGLYLAD